MEIYKDIYKFEVIDAITNGKRVYVVDKKLKKIAPANDMRAEKLLAIVNSDNEDHRFEFYVESHVKENAKETNE